MASLTIPLTLCAITSVWLLKRLLQRSAAVAQTLKDVGSCPGRGRLLYNPFGGLSLAIDRFSPFKWRFHDYHAAFDLYAHFQSTVLSSFVIWNGEQYYWLSDADAIKTVCNSRNIFEKDLPVYEKFLNFWGSNIISTEGNEWKMHRGVARSAFNEANNALVWSETTRISSQWMSNLKKEVEVDLLEDLRLITMQVIQGAGFGRRPTWAEASSKQADGDRMPFEEALATAGSNLIPRSITPSWLIDIAEKAGIKKLTVIRTSFDDIKFHMLDLVQLARSWLAGDDKDKALDAALLRNLVQGNNDEAESNRLDDGQLLSNAFIFLVAGHETTAHSLSFMVAFLAIYPEVQRKVREEVLSLTGGDPTVQLSYKEHMSKLVYTLAVFYETGRLCTVAPRLGRRVLSDTTLTSRRFEIASDGSAERVQEFDVSLKRGSQVIVDLTAVHRNPIHWGRDVNEFKPERFIDTDTYHWPRNAFLAFSTGHRSCIGQKFSTTESLCLVANLVRQFDILPPPDLRDKSFSEQKGITDWKTWLTSTPSNARVTFKPRF